MKQNKNIYPKILTLSFFISLLMIVPFLTSCNSVTVDENEREEIFENSFQVQDLTIIYDGNNAGVKNAKNDIIIPPKYQLLDKVSPDMILAGIGNKMDLFDDKGRKYLNNIDGRVKQYREFDIIQKYNKERTEYYSVKSKKSIIGDLGSYSFEKEREGCINVSKYIFSCPFKVKTDKGVNFYDNNLNPILEKFYKEGCQVDDNYFLIVDNLGRNGIVDKNGKSIIPLKEGSITYHKRQKIFIRAFNNLKLSTAFDSLGQRISSENFNEIKVVENYLLVRKDELYGIYKPNGNEVFPLDNQVKSIFSFNNKVIFKINGYLYNEESLRKLDVSKNLKFENIIIKTFENEEKLTFVIGKATERIYNVEVFNSSGAKVDVFKSNSERSCHIEDMNDYIVFEQNNDKYSYGENLCQSPIVFNSKGRLKFDKNLIINSIDYVPEDKAFIFTNEDNLFGLIDSNSQIVIEPTKNHIIKMTQENTNTLNSYWVQNKAKQDYKPQDLSGESIVFNNPVKKSKRIGTNSLKSLGAKSGSSNSTPPPPPAVYRPIKDVPYYNFKLDYFITNTGSVYSKSEGKLLYNTCSDQVLIRSYLSYISDVVGEILDKNNKYSISPKNFYLFDYQDRTSNIFKVVYGYEKSNNMVLKERFNFLLDSVGLINSNGDWILKPAYNRRIRILNCNVVMVNDTLYYLENDKLKLLHTKVKYGLNSLVSLRDENASRQYYNLIDENGEINTAIKIREQFSLNDGSDNKLIEIYSDDFMTTETCLINAEGDIIKNLKGWKPDKYTNKYKYTIYKNETTNRYQLRDTTFNVIFESQFISFIEKEDQLKYLFSQEDENTVKLFKVDNLIEMILPAEAAKDFKLRFDTQRNYFSNKDYEMIVIQNWSLILDKTGKLLHSLENLEHNAGISLNRNNGFNIIKLKNILDEKYYDYYFSDDYKDLIKFESSTQLLE